MATTSDIKNGVVLLENGKRMKVLEFLHVKPERKCFCTNKIT